METQTVHFSVSGEYLTNFARGRFADGDPKKAVEVLTIGLNGMPLGIACDIVMGKKKLVGWNELELEDDNVSEHSGIKLDWEDAYKRLCNKYFEQLGMMQMLKRRIIHYGNSVNSYGACYRRDGFEDSKTYETVRLKDDREDYTRRKYRFDEITEELLFVSERLGKTLLDLPVEKFEPMPDFVTLHKPNDAKMHFDFDYLLNGDIKTIENEDDDRQIRMQEVIKEGEAVKSQVDSFIDNSIKIEKKLSKKIKPNDILDMNSAGWLAPNGDWYGLDGDIANQLHNQIAEALVKAKIIKLEKDDVYGFNPDLYLAKNGWVKVHGHGLMYEGYNNQKHYDRPNLPLTEIQKEKLEQYGQRLDPPVLKLGINGQFGEYDGKYVISAVRITLMTDHALEVAFGI